MANRLEYGRPSRPHRSRRFRPFFVILAVAVVVCTIHPSIRRWIAYAANHAKLRYYQQRWIGKRFAEGEVVYEERSPLKEALLATDRYIAVHGENHDWAEERNLHWTSPAGYYDPMLVIMHCYLPIAFSHSRVMADGKSIVLIVGTRYAILPDQCRVIEFEGMTQQPISIFGAYARDTEDTNGLWVVLKDSDVFTAYGGNPDKADSSGFSIPYMVNGVSGVIRGQLRRKDRIVWHVDGPLAGSVR